MIYYTKNANQKLKAPSALLRNSLNVQIGKPNNAKVVLLLLINSNTTISNLNPFLVSQLQANLQLILMKHLSLQVKA